MTKYVIKKDTEDGTVTAEADDISLEGLKEHGWTVVEDGNSESGQVPERHGDTPVSSNEE